MPLECVAVNDVTFTLEMEPGSFAEKLGAPATRAYMRKQNARAMERLKALLEAPVSSGSSAPANGGH